MLVAECHGAAHVARGRERGSGPRTWLGAVHAESAQRAQWRALGPRGAGRGEVRRGAERRERGHAGSRGAGWRGEPTRRGEVGAARRVPSPTPLRLAVRQLGIRAGRWSAAPAHLTRRTRTWVSAIQC